MDRTALDWLFSTAPQTIAALVGFIFAGVSFILGKIDERVDNDETITEIANEMKSQIHLKLKRLLWWAVGGIVIDCLCLFANRYIEDYKLSLSGEFSWYFTFAIIVFIVNMFIIGYAIHYVVGILKPSFFDNIIKSMEKKYVSGKGSISKFIEKYIEFEKALRKLEQYSNNNFQKHMTIYQLAREAYNREFIDKKEMEEIMSITRIRNIVVHGGEIYGIDPNRIKQLESITQKLNSL